jgi:hypothetical protein
VGADVLVVGRTILEDVPQQPERRIVVDLRRHLHAQGHRHVDREARRGLGRGDLDARALVAALPLHESAVVVVAGTGEEVEDHAAS